MDICRNSWIIRSRKNRWFWNSSAVCSSHKILTREVDEYQSNCYLRPLFHFSSFTILVLLNFSGHNFDRDADILLHFIFGNFQQFQSEFQSQKQNASPNSLSRFFVAAELSNYSVDFAYLQYIPSPYGTYIGYKKGCLPLSNRKTHLGAATKTEEIEIDWI